MNSLDKSSLPRRILQESRYADQKPEKKKFNGLKLPRFLRPTSKSTTSNDALPPSKKHFFHSKKRIAISVVILLIFIAGGGAVGWYEYQLSQNPAVIYAKKLKSITDIASQQVALPKDEQPVVATVSDVTKLPNEAFFKEAQDGDKILMYKKHKEAILYRPTTGQVITEAVLNFENVTPTPVSQQAVAGASTSAVILGVTPIAPSSTPAPYIPQGKILIQPQK